MSYSRDAGTLLDAEKRFGSFKSFRAFSSVTWVDGALSLGEKHVVAVAAAHVTGCEFCIENHSRAARRAGFTVEAVLGASFVVSAVNALDDDDAAAVASVLTGDEASELDTEPRFRFLLERLDDEALSPGFSYVIAATAAYLGGEEKLTPVFARLAGEAGASEEQLDDAFTVGRTIRAGSVYAHNAAVLRAFAP